MLPLDKVATYFRARVALINLVCPVETGFDIDMIQNMQNKVSPLLFSYDLLNGLRWVQAKEKPSAAILKVINEFKQACPEGTPPAGVITTFTSYTRPCESGQVSAEAKFKSRLGDAILLLKDVWCGVTPIVRRALLNHQAYASEGICILLSPSPIEDPVLTEYMPAIREDLPDIEYLKAVFDSVIRPTVGSRERLFLDNDGSLAPATQTQLVTQSAKALVGLHRPCALNTLTLHLGEALLREKASCTFAISPKELLEKKADILNRDGYMQLILEHLALDRLGGLDLLKNWLLKRREAFDEETVKAGLPYPKGIVLVGPPGTAKSLTAKIIAGVFQVPLIRLDISSLFQSLLGKSEASMRNALAVADASAPCVLWLDEIFC